MPQADLDHVQGPIGFEIVDERDASAAARRFEGDADPSEAHDGILAIRAAAASESERDDLVERLNDTVFGSDVIHVHAAPAGSVPLRFRLIGGSVRTGDGRERPGEAGWPLSFRAKQIG